MVPTKQASRRKTYTLSLESWREVWPEPAVEPVQNRLNRVIVQTIKDRVYSLILYMVRKKEVVWRHERVTKATRACKKDNAGEVSLEDEDEMSEGISEESRRRM